MKFKLIFLVVFVMFAQVVNAQTFGIKGGANLANMSLSPSGMGISTKSIIGFQAGPVAEFELLENLCLNTGIMYSLKGSEMKMGIDISGTTVEIDVTKKINFIEIPINLAYKFPINRTSNFFIQAGPYVGYAFSGKNETEGETEDIDFEEEGIRKLDYGIGGGPGVEFGPVVASLNYQLGLCDLYGSKDVKVTNKVIQFSVAYMFGR